MESISTAMKRVEAQEMISRFRSKEGLYRYLTQHDRNTKLPRDFYHQSHEDVMKDEELVVYLPTKKKLSNKLPERSFFFDFLGTLRESYLREIIEEAHKKRYSISPEDQKKQGLLISETWLVELKKHPYLSRKPGTGIFLMKEHAKAHRERKSQTIHEVSKRLYKDFQKPDEMNIDAGAGTKRRNMGPSKPQEEEKQEKPNPIMSQFNM